MGVRRESVELSLADAGFTTGMAKAAAQTALLNRELGNLDGTSVKADRSTRQLADGGIKKTGDQSRSSSDDLNKYTGRLNALVSAAVTVGPALVPVTAGLIPGITGMAAGLGAAAGAAGVAVLAFHGIGDALTALDKANLQPTAANMATLNEKMAALGPAGQNFVHFLDDLEPKLHSLQATAQAGLLPGVQTGLEALLPLLPQVRTLVGSISAELGSLAGKAGTGLANDPEFVAFFHYLQTDAAPTLDAFAKATGNVAAGLAQMTVDFAPVNRDFASGLVSATEDFRRWSDGLQQSQGFHEFIAYMESNGPKAVELLGSLGSALLGIAQAAAPVGAVVLPILTDLLKIIAAIGKSPLGPVIYTGVAATIAFNKGAELMSKLLARLTGQTAALSAEMKGLAASTAEVDAAAAAGGGVGRSAGLLKTGLLASGVAVGGYLTAQGSQNAMLALTGLNHPITNPGAQQQKIISDLIGTQSWTSQINPLKADFDPLAGLTHGIDKGLGILGIGNASDSMHKQLSSASDVLAQNVQNGQGAEAAKTFAQISEAAKRSGVSLKDVNAAFLSYRSAAKAAGVSTNAATAAQQANTAAALKQAAALKATVDAALGAFDAETQYRQALAAATDQAKKSNAGFKGNSAEVLANRQALSGLAGAWNQQIQAMAANGASADQIKAKYAAARQELIKTATGMGATAAQARQYAHQLLQTPKSIATQFTVSVDAGALGALEDRLARLAGKHTKTYVDVVQQGLTGKQIALQQRAQGGHITGPGTSTSDSIPAYLSNGEYVVKAAAVQRYGTHMFDSLNAMRFAAGGPVQSHHSLGTDHSIYTVPFNSKVSWPKAEEYAEAEKAVDRLTRALDALTKQSDELTKAQQAAQSNYDTLTSGVTSNLTSGDLFGGSGGSVFGQQYAAGSIGSVNAKLTQQIKDANDTTALEKSLAGRGLSSDALQALISQGGIGGLRSFSNASDADLAQYQSLYGQRGTAVSDAATTAAGVTGLTAQLAQANAQLAAIKAAITQTTNQQARAQNQATKAKAALATKQAKQTGQHVAKALNTTAKKAKNK